MLYLNFTLPIKGYLYEWICMEHWHLDGLDMEGLFVIPPLPPIWLMFSNEWVCCQLFCGFHCYLGSIISMVSWKRLSSIPHTLIEHWHCAWCWDNTPASLSGILHNCYALRGTTHSLLFSLIFDFVPKRDKRKVEEKKKLKRKKRKEEIRTLKISDYSKQKSCLW